MTPNTFPYGRQYGALPRDRAFVVAGTDTGVGKTVISAMLTAALDGVYWKPIQTGAANPDSAAVLQLTGFPSNRVLPERYRLREPLSPHRAAELERVSIELDALVPLPAPGRVLIVETAGGLLVPVTRTALQIDLIALWGAPVVLVGRTSLGAINHALLSLEALARRRIPVLGMAFVGDENPDTERSICAISGVRQLGRLPRLDALEPRSLLRAFRRNFDAAAFAPAGRRPELMTQVIR